MSLPNPCIEDLPVPLMVDILSRLPVKTIIHCKCVCKTWRNIVLDRYFGDTQLARSTAGFIIYFKPGMLKWVEVKDELNHHNLHHDPVMRLDLKLVANLKDSRIIPVGSVNGLVCLRQVGSSIDNNYICNPITREYMILPRHKYHFEQGTDRIISCFGVGSLTRKYKVIRIFQKRLITPDSTPKLRLSLSEAEVYTLGTGQWRSLGHVPYWFNEYCGQFLNGHAHWNIGDKDSGEKICSFNLDNETFDLFPSPPCEATTEESRIPFRRLGVLKGCLFRCDTHLYKITVWVMKEYGIKKSWHKELVIEKGICDYGYKPFVQPTCHVVAFKNGTFLMTTFANNLLEYCPQKKEIVETELFDDSYRFGPVYRPSFHRLQCFENECVHLL